MMFSTMEIRMRITILSLSVLLAGPTLANEVWPLNDEFDDSSTLADWQRVDVVEQWGAEPLETWDIDTSEPGRMTLVPTTATWFRNWRGALAFKEISGDFAITTNARVTARDGVSLPDPASEYSLGGIMIRTPRTITPATWTPGGENFVFLSVGQGNANRWQNEIKTTTDSDSELRLSNAAGPDCELRIVRLGTVVVALLRDPCDVWRIHDRFERTDLPDTLQAGVVAYTDWAKCQTFDPFVHNANVLVPPLVGIVDPSPDLPFNPDCRATFDYVRFDAPIVPMPLEGLDLLDAGQVSDAQLLAFLGDALDHCDIDLNADGSAEVIDLLTYLVRWFDTEPTADRTCDGVVDVTDLLDYLGAWFVGC